MKAENQPSSSLQVLVDPVQTWKQSSSRLPALKVPGLDLEPPDDSSSEPESVDDESVAGRPAPDISRGRGACRVQGRDRATEEGRGRGRGDRKSVV